MVSKDGNRPIVTAMKINVFNQQPTKMKKYTEIILVSLFSISVITSCKKDSDGYSASIKDKTWWGTMTYTIKPTPVYYSVHFNANGSLLWSELSGDYSGHWVIDGNHLTISLNTVNREVKTDISGDNKFGNISQSGTNGDIINSGELIPDPNTSSLDNTVWNGYYSVGGVQKPLQMSFKPNFILEWKSGSNATWTYTRTASGVVIRYGGTVIFGIVLSGYEMKGTSIFDYWQVRKQP
jgi:hypothetical protein